MRGIGGFLEQETNLCGSGERHQGAMLTRTSSGRASFRIILERTRPQRVRVPFYSCDALLEPLQALQIPYSFYALDARFEPSGAWRPGPDECVVVVNYFGLQSAQLRAFGRELDGRLVVDNTQAFFDGACAGAHAFNSARKWFGVPDGSYLYSPVAGDLRLEENRDVSLLHLVRRAAGDLAGGYAAFTAAEARVGCEVRGMSSYTRDVLAHIDYDRVVEVRRRLFQEYAAGLGAWNQWACPLPGDAVPFCYPFLPDRVIDRQRLYGQGIFVPTLWRDVVERAGEDFGWERNVARRLLPLPVDHRYGPREAQTVVAAIKEILGI